ncbi:MAG: VanZ family protein [Burkholderiaceae bacterium]
MFSQASPVSRVAFFACVIVVLVLSLMPIEPNMPTTGWDKTNHLLAFAVLAVLGCWSYPASKPAVLFVLLAYGGLIEVLQSFTAYRFAEWADVLADALGLLTGYLLLWAGAVTRARRPRS